MGVLVLGIYGNYAKFVIQCLRLHPRNRYQAPSREAFTEPAVYICRHSNAKGPIASIINMPMEIHPWSLHVFHETESCRKHYAEYTFRVRFGWSKFKSELVARLGAWAFTALLHSVGSIPVYRNSAKIYNTFKQSMEALKNGESVLVFPDVDYTKTDGDTGDLYNGFVILERMYFKETGKHLPFVTLHISDAKKEIFLGEPVMFEEGVPFKQQQQTVVQKLHDVMNELIEKHGN